MSNLTKILALAICCSFTACERETEDSPQEAMVKIARAAGVDGFEAVDSMSYTFHADLGEKTVARSWVWLPETDKVTLHGETDSEDVSYLRSEVSSDETGKLATIDQQFVNDLYWLIFPLQVAWDSGVVIEPLPEDAAGVVPEVPSGLRVRYSDGVGYTPGDVYDLFYDKDFRVTHWVFRKAGSAEPTRVSEWKDYQSFGPLSISLNRLSPDNSVRIWFDGVSVELAE